MTPTGAYVLTSPCFANVTIQLPAVAASFAGYGAANLESGSATSVPLLHIVAHNFSATNYYVASAVLNGAPLPTPFVTHTQLMPPLRVPRPGEDAATHAARVVGGGGASLLEYTLTDTPSVWGSA